MAKVLRFGKKIDGLEPKMVSVRLSHNSSLNL